MRNRRDGSIDTKDTQLARFDADLVSALGGMTDYPYFPMTEEEYRKWFSDAATPVGDDACANMEKLIDIQPSGEADFCVDFTDFVIGSVKESTIAELWNSPRAEAFRTYRRKQPLAVCS